MSRYASQLMLCSPDYLLRRTMVELNHHGIINAIVELDNLRAETAGTLFYDGIISAAPVAWNKNLNIDKAYIPENKYQYICLPSLSPDKQIIPDGRTLLLDWGTTDLFEINQLIPKIAFTLHLFDLMSIIAASIYYPAMIQNIDNNIEVGSQCSLLLWKNADLVNRKLLTDTSLEILR